MARVMDGLLLWLSSYVSGVLLGLVYDGSRLDGVWIEAETGGLEGRRGVGRAR